MLSSIAHSERMKWHAEGNLSIILAKRSISFVVTFVQFGGGLFRVAEVFQTLRFRGGDGRQGA